MAVWSAALCFHSAEGFLSQRFDGIGDSAAADVLHFPATPSLLQLLHLKAQDLHMQWERWGFVSF